MSAHRLTAGTAKYVISRSAQPSISPGSVKRGPATAGKTKAWFILFVDKLVGGT